MLSRRLSPKALIASYIFLTVMSLMILLPILWMLSTSLKTDSELFSTPPKWIPGKITFAAFKRMWTDYPFIQYFINSIWVVTCATFVSILFSTLAGYGMSRFRFHGRALFLTFLLMTQMFPSIMLLIPFYKIMTNYNLINTYSGLILTYISFTIPYCSWTMMGYFNTIPKEIDEAAFIDGSGRFRIFIQIIMPLTLPGIAATAIYSFVNGWNEYMFAATLMTTESMKTASVGIGQLNGQYNILWNDMMSASIVATVPICIFFVFFQKYLISGLTSGAVK